MPKDNPTPAETSTSGKSDSSSSQLTKAERLRNKKKYSQILRTVMDEKAPIRKKVGTILILLQPTSDDGGFLVYLLYLTDFFSFA